MTTAMRKTLKAIFLIAITVGMTIALSALSIGYYPKQQDHVNKVIPDGNGYVDEDDTPALLPSKRVSRFLAESSGYNHHGRSLKPADHCHKDYEVCDLQYGANYTCCGNKCFDLLNDKAHCGFCHKKCKYTYSCCGGQCVDLAYDKRHCGGCNKKCLYGQYCIYGMCDYA